MRYFKIILLIMFLSACRKKTDIKVRVYNYALGEPITDAKVVLIKTKLSGGLFSAGYDCKTIEEKTVDADGYCFFSDEKLRTDKTYQYACKIKYAYGKDVRYNCNPTENSVVIAGKTNEKILHDETFDCFFKVIYNNTLNPSISGDSLIVYMTSPIYEVPGQPFPFGGGGVFNNKNLNADNNYPYPSYFSSDLIKSFAGKHVLKIYKKKMGVVTQTVDTIKIYPYETKTIEINW